MKSVVKKLTQGGLELLFPPKCLYCSEHLDLVEDHGFLCRSCYEEIEYISSPLCLSCGVGFYDWNGKDHLCGECLKQRPAYQAARAVAVYGPVVQYLLHRLKYSGDSAVLPAIRRIAGRVDNSLLAASELIIPVPLHKKRLQQRGLNQSLILARLFFPDDRNKIDYTLLLRVQDTVPQTSLDGEQRRKNLRGAFKVSAPAQINNKSICLVDDVLTTGTTVSECSRALINAGAKEVKVLTFARA